MYEGMMAESVRIAGHGLNAGGKPC